MMRSLILSALLLTAGLAVLSADDQGVDDVTRQATQLEAELSKLRSTTSEAAEVMLQLTNLYYEHGRAFGLIRVGQSFVALHTTHPKHRDVMLKLLDGLLVTGRTKEVIATGRQFVVRYPQDSACADVERLLAQLLSRGNEIAGAAAVNESRWKRLGPTPEGIAAGTAAVTQYASIKNADNYTKAAMLADEMLDKVPPGPAATVIGWQAVENWERVNNWAKANLSGARLLQKAPPTQAYYLRELHRRMGENYARANQRVNAVESFRKALAVKDLPPSVDIYHRYLGELYATRPQPAEFEAAVAEYVKSFPTRNERHGYRTLLANLYNAAKEKAKAEQVVAEVLPFDARSHSAVSVYLSLIPAERTAEAEKVIRNAIAQSTPANAVPLRYHLAIDIYRDRLKDLAKAKALAREFVYQFPVNEGYTGTLAHWLLNTAESDAEFQNELTKLLAVRKERPYWEYHRGIVPAWLQANAGKKELAARVKITRAALAAADKDPVFADWLALEASTRASNIAQMASHRAKILVPERTAALPDDVANNLYQAQQYYFRYQAPAAKQAQSVAIAKAWTQRLPKSEYAAQQYLSWTTDFAAAAEYRHAAAHLIQIEPTSASSDIARRLLQCAAGAKDAALGKQCWAYIQKAQEKFGYDPSQSGTMGDYLEALGLKEEAMACWRRGLTSYESQDCRYCFDRILARTMDPAAKAQLVDEMLKHEGYWRFNFAMLKADALLKANDVAGFARLLREAAERQRARPFGGWNPDYDWQLGVGWVTSLRNDAKVTPADKRTVFTVIRDLEIRRPSQAAALALLELPDEEKQSPMQRLLAISAATRYSYGDATDWDQMLNFAQAAMARKDYVAASALVSGMLASCPTIDEGRRKPGRDMLTQAYSRMGAAGAAIDDKSPIAPLLQAALHLRLGDHKLAFDTYLANQKLFDAHRSAVPVDLLAFVCESHMASGGDDNFNRVEEILRGWIVKNSESKEIDEVDKARVQLLLARNFFRAKRYDIARAEYTTVQNRYAKTPQAVEAEFGIGETFMEQKVYDQAELVFERLAGSRQRDVVIRAEFLRGVLAGRRGDLDEARAIFRSVLERVPTAELANQVLYNLSEVYGAEQRYVDQLELLRTIGRLGRVSKRWHTPGEPLSIVVQDSDLGVSRGHARIPVRVTTEPAGDEEIIYLRSGGAGKGLFRADLETRLGNAAKGDKVLQLTGNDVIRCDYPDEFKKEFKEVPLPDAEIRVAANARFEMASGQIVDIDDESFSRQLEREAKGDEDKRKSIDRPATQVKPGNLIYFRVKDADRDLTSEPDKVTVKLSATSGDQVTVTLTETGPHTGVFQGTVRTGELPAGALATNTAIDHSPLMAIDRDPASFWISEPDGVTPKILTIDMKDLKVVDRVTISTPDVKQHAPVRATLEGSNDGRIWFRLAANPAPQASPAVDGEFGRMTRRGYLVNATAYTTWDQVVALSKTKPTDMEVADQLFWERPADLPKTAYAVIWQGKLVQRRAGAVRIHVAGDTTAIMVDGHVELPVARGSRFADLWLDAGSHELTVFAAAGPVTPRLETTWARSDASTTAELPLLPFREIDFNLNQPEAKPAPARKPAEVAVQDANWQFQFTPAEVRFVRLVIHEYRGEAVAINQVTIADSVKNQVHVPTETDLLSLATNDVIEMAGGDVIKAAYIDEQNLTGSSRLLTAQLTATYHNAQITPITFDFVKTASGAVATVRKQALRIDPGDRFIIEVTDFDMDQTANTDTIKVSVAVNDGPPIELVAHETGENTGVFTKEVDTSAATEKDRLTVKAGDRIWCRYVDQQNTVPGHAVPRETAVLVSEPTDGRLRIVETRMVRPKDPKQSAQVVYLPAGKDRPVAGVAFEAPLTIEIIDPDAAKDSRSTVVAVVTTSDGAQVEVECVLSDTAFNQPGQVRPGLALEEGRFIGQVIMQLGGKDSPSVLPLTANMPRNLIGRPIIPKEEDISATERTLITQVLNLTGKDTIEVVYNDARRASTPPAKLTAQGRLISDAKLTCTDAEYQSDRTAAHVGERLYLKVMDADLDRSNERDLARIVVTSQRGEREVVELIETAAHSGIFTGSVMLKAEAKPTPNNFNAADAIIETWFGDQLEVLYLDELASTPGGSMECQTVIQVVIGTDGKLSAFSKNFADETLAVETQFHIAESHFELFKSHKAIEREEEARADLEAGRRVLRGVMRDYPNPKYTPRVAYLLGQFAQELKQWGEAIESYQLIIKQYPDHSLAAEAQFRLAQCYEESGDFNQALEAYVTLAATYPKNPLIAHVMLRINEHYYKAENYKVAAQVGEKFLEKFEGHKWASRMAFRVGQCYHKDKLYAKAAEAFDRFTKSFPDDPLASDALFWAGESYRMANSARQAFIRYNNCRWKYPESEAAKYSRGRLALPEMLRQFEVESNLDNK